MKNSFSDIRLFGYRVLVERVTERRGAILFPESRTTLHQLGRVVVVGDGLVPDGNRPSITKPALVSVGDTVLFQTHVMAATSSQYQRGDESLLNLDQGDLLARIDSSNAICWSNYEPLGRWVLIEPFMRRESSLIVLPTTAEKDPSFLYFKVSKLGSQVNLPLKAGQEVLLNIGRLNALQMPVSELAITSGETMKEYGYIDRDFVLGCVDAPEA